MDLLQREMERKRKALQEAKKKQGGSSNRRYVKTSELRRLMEECDNDTAAYDSKVSATKSQEDQVAIEESKSEDIASPSQTERESSITSSSGDVTARQTKKLKLDLNTSKAKTSNPPSHLAEEKSLAQIKRELRELGQPVTLFGETTLQQRLVRLEQAAQQRAVVRLQETEANEFRLGQGHGIRNPFLEKEKDIAGQSGVDLSVSVSTVQTKSSSRSATDGQRHDNDDKPDMDNNNRNSKNETTDDENDPHKRIYRHFKGLLKQWEADLNDRPEDIKRSLAGRNERKTVKQCKDYIRPLFVLCKRRQLEEGLLKKLDELVQFAQEGEFVKAHDAYLDVAIGRAAWPIGVTMVGIHARSGRAKIESSNVAHVMNSELQRKYLTSVKRLLTYEQSKRTDVDPSKKVLH
jgi:pre-mRNA-splicing factor 18